MRLAPYASTIILIHEYVEISGERYIALHWMKEPKRIRQVQLTTLL
ncbi:hypothetical protein S7335_3798 [Synechococcus sp. PCC 7335]|nr:hypothetical protein S7335_3798 [Synechococcus sp. PCC 7335]